METVNARELRRSLGSVLDRLERGGGPILVFRRRTPAAALVSLRTTANGSSTARPMNGGAT